MAFTAHFGGSTWWRDVYDMPWEAWDGLRQVVEARAQANKDAAERARRGR